MTTRAPESFRGVPVESRQSAAPARYANVILGIWLFISAFAWQHQSAARTNTWVVGLLIAVVGLIATRSPSARYANTALAVWLAISTLFVWPVVEATYWNNLIVAAAVFAVSLVSGSGRGPAEINTAGRRL